MRLFIIEQNALSTAGHYYSYTLCIAAAARQLGHAVTILHNRHFHGVWPVPGAVHLDPFTLGWGEAEGLGASQWGARSISLSFERAVAEDPPGPDDHVLFHTLGFAELADLIDHFATRPDRARLPNVHMLLRYDPAPMQQAADVFRQRFRQIATSPLLSRKVRFHTDTVPLAQSYAALSGLPFTCLPIPFDQSPLRQASRGPASVGNAITFIYLGDARQEKGYDLLPDAVAHVRADPRYGPRTRFVIQSNFNVPGGEPGLMAARNALAAIPGVELLPAALDEEMFAARLAQADVVVIPYAADSYRSRSSGILVQARAAGKPLVTTAGSWMSTQVDQSCAVVYGKGTSLGSALLEACRSLDALSLGAERNAEAAQREAAPQNFVTALLANSGTGAPPARGGRVLVIMDGDAMVLCNGASRVALAQFHYLRNAGHEVCAIFIGYNPEGLAGDLLSWKRKLREQINAFDLEHVFVVLPSRLGLQLRDDIHEQPSIAADVARHRHLDLGAELMRFVRGRRFDAVLLNNVTTMPLVDALGLGETPIICEMHDVQSLQKAIYGHRHVHPADVEREIALLARCRHLISLNPHETLFVRDHLPETPITTRGIFFPQSAATDGNAPPAGGSLPGSVPPRGGFGEAAGAAFDMLFIGSNHLPNIRGLQWFIDEVFLPDLAPRGRTLVVAGSVTIGGHWPEAPGISYLGRVDAVAPLYAAARIVILPLLDGAGSPIKTLEAIDHAVPIVATATAMRGIDEGLHGGVVVCGTGREFRDAIDELLDDEEAWVTRARAAAAAGRRLKGVDDYTAAMDAIFRQALSIEA